MSGDPDQANAAARGAIELAPGRADLQLRLATQLIQLGRTEEAVPLLKNLGRLDPAQRYMHLFQLALAAIYADLGDMNHARASLAEVLHIRPDFSLADLPRLRTGREWLAENLRKAGLGE